MFRTAARRRFVAPSAKRYVHTPRFAQPRSWKSLAARTAIAGGIVYYYTAYTVADEGDTGEFGREAKRNGADGVGLRRIAPSRTVDVRGTEKEAAATTPTTPTAPDTSTPDELQEEAGEQGAFNEETGEINWDCPCLGGMAHGPCGEKFKDSFRCFVFSKEEPKGVECIDHFNEMRKCFLEHPDVYGGWDEDGGAEGEGEAAPAPETETLPGTDQAAVSKATETVEKKTEAEKEADEGTHFPTDAHNER
ncbi:hypothetical protein K470DRAFT_247307 [Piedraia hortae CBS 480.64]|uniref:Mitochondrial intermembrane space import and assembly protein 40 n=1 Tax=Piedraia hortae CBS 480.64 TaxID=1314780 RepID=A0A6A7C0H9_9PEZI|nr:hypothetical protein K470DRAFT_247307 [Piedraia hortae CBS 480.64]